MLRVIDSYNGPGEIVLSDGRRYPLVCAYTVFVDSEAERPENLPAWGGSYAADHAVQGELIGEQARLELPDGRAGDVLVIDNLGGFTGTGSPPEISSTGDLTSRLALEP
jgi:hypothetical protein